MLSDRIQNVTCNIPNRGRDSVAAVTGRSTHLEMSAVREGRSLAEVMAPSIFTATRKTSSVGSFRLPPLVGLEPGRLLLEWLSVTHRCTKEKLQRLNGPEACVETLSCAQEPRVVANSALSSLYKKHPKWHRSMNITVDISCILRILSSRETSQYCIIPELPGLQWADSLLCRPAGGLYVFPFPLPSRPRECRG